MALTVIHSLKDRNKWLDRPWYAIQHSPKNVFVAQKQAQDLHCLGVRMSLLLLTLHRVAVSMFLHQNAGPQLHCSVPSSLRSASGQAPTF